MEKMNKYSEYLYDRSLCLGASFYSSSSSSGSSGSGSSGGSGSSSGNSGSGSSGSGNTSLSLGNITVSVTSSATSDANVGYSGTDAYETGTYTISVGAANAKNISAILYVGSSSSYIAETSNKSSSSTKTVTLSQSGSYNLVIKASRGSASTSAYKKFDVVPKGKVRIGKWVSETLKGNVSLDSSNDELSIMGSAIRQSTSSSEFTTINQRIYATTSSFENTLNNELNSRIRNQNAYCVNDYWDLYREATNSSAEDISITSSGLAIKMNGKTITFPSGAIWKKSNSTGEKAALYVKTIAQLLNIANVAGVDFSTKSALVNLDSEGNFENNDKWYVSSQGKYILTPEKLFLSNNPEKIGKDNKDGVSTDLCLADNGYCLAMGKINGRSMIYTWHTNNTGYTLHHQLLLQSFSSCDANTVDVEVEFYKGTISDSDDADAWMEYLERDTSKKIVTFQMGPRETINLTKKINDAIQSYAYGVDVSDGQNFGDIVLINTSYEVTVMDIVYNGGYNNIYNQAPNEFIIQGSTSISDNYKRGIGEGFNLYLYTPTIVLSDKEAALMHYGGTMADNDKYPNHFIDVGNSYAKVTGIDGERCNDGLYGMETHFETSIYNNSDKPKNYYVVLGSQALGETITYSKFIVNHGNETGAFTATAGISVPCVHILNVGVGTSYQLAFKVIHPALACAPYIVGIVDSTTLK